MSSCRAPRRAPFACDPAASRGRVFDEPESRTRSPFQRDRDRIIHSAAFRRLMHKTQVFVSDEGDHYRTRLTHSLEVAQIARSIARVLGLDEDLTEALALCHDVGHTPFGHAGERALARCMADCGGFDHNLQTLRIVTRLESRYAAFDGLNLTLETLEGIVKHNGPVDAGLEAPAMSDIAALERDHGLFLPLQAPAEAQVAALADDIAYDAHDVDDGHRAGLFDIEALRAVALVNHAVEEVEGLYPGLERPRLVHETVRRIIDAMVDALLRETRARIADGKPESVSDVRYLGMSIVSFSEEMAASSNELKTFLQTNMYRHPKVLARARRAEAVVEALFGAYRDAPGELPEDWRRGLDAGDRAGLGRRICDFIAGMTDRYALAEHARMFNLDAAGL